jgi:hypothetical protein
MRFYLFFFFFLMSKCLVFSQNEVKTLHQTLSTTEETLPQKFFTMSLGATWHTRKDDLFSPLTYSGYGAELHTGSERISEKRFKQFDFWGNGNNIQSRVNQGYNYSAYGFRYGISYMQAYRILPQNPNFKLYVGGSVFHTSSMGYYPGNVNNIFSYNAPTGLAASAFLMKNITFLKKKWVLSTQLAIPVLAYDARPSYIGFVDVQNLTKDFGIVSLNKLLNIDWRWQIDYPLSNGNRLRAIYRWDYMSDTHNGHLQAATHSFSIQMMSNIPYKKRVVSSQ